VSDGELIYLVTSLGEVTGFDARDGKQVWQHNLDFEVQASPAIAGRQLIILSTAGDVVSVECGRAFKELGRTKLADAFYASPAFGADRMFLRGTTNLWCLAQPKP
jgi:outer membrane protein assembly factor BamB